MRIPGTSFSDDSYEPWGQMSKADLWAALQEARGRLTFDEIAVALRNIGYPTDCATCMEIFYTGATTHFHTCGQSSLSPDEPSTPVEAPVHGLDDLAERCLALCIEKGWSRHWEAVGCHMHLEASEFIEALRGKHGDPIEEAGDVLFVLLSAMGASKLSVAETVAALERKLVKVRTKEVPNQRPESDRGASPLE